MSARGKQWKLREIPPPAHLAHLHGSTVVATLLYQRLYPHTSADQYALDQFSEIVTHFLEDRYPTGLHDPLLLKGMSEASARIAHAIVEGEPMAVYGDFDTDGVTAVTLLMQAIPAMGGNIRPYIPHRDREGYGLNREAITHLVDEGVRLLITVDCGISNLEEVAYASSLGLDVIVTDHHRPPPELPPALAVVNPKQEGCTYPYDQLVGVGIAFKLVQALFKRGMRLDGLRGRDLLDVVALGTVADMAPLTGENRVLVKIGLEAMRETQRPGLLALMQVSGVERARVTSASIGFLLGPRLNAAGRLDDAILAYDLLLADNLAAAQRLAADLNQKNRERQTITKRVQEQASAAAEATGQHEQRIVVLHSDDYPAGVVGLVAGKLVEQWARPVILLARGENEARGSARSIPAFNIFEALSICKDLFVRFGGHSMAAGFTIANDNLPELETRLHALAEEQLTDDMLQPTLYIDAEADLDDLTWELLDDIQRLEPFGQGNQQPVLMSRAVRAVDVRTMGNENQHLRLRLVSSQSSEKHVRTLNAVAFGLGHLAEPLRKYPTIDIAYTLEANSWQGTQSLQLKVKDFRSIK